VIAILVGHEDMRGGPIPIALEHAGIEAREIATTDEADAWVERHGAQACVLLVEAGCLRERTGSGSWTGFLVGHRALPAVVVAAAGAAAEARAVSREPHRILLENPFDAAAVVEAVQRAAATRRPAVRRADQEAREAG
jgi:DNA-binding NtrC family response regulator